VLYIIATPIGNLEDITLRAIRILKEVDYILAEDTRQSSRLLQHLGIIKPLSSFFEHNEEFKIPKIIDDLSEGKNIALISDAGTPTISDPGYKLIRDCKEKGLPVTGIPGPSSVINALVLSSAPRDKFVFMGYIPKKPGERGRFLCKIKANGLTAVVFETAPRLLKSLQAMAEELGECRLTIAREMTKKFEEAREMTVFQTIEYFQEHEPRGEIVIVIHRIEDKKGEKNVS